MMKIVFAKGSETSSPSRQWIDIPRNFSNLEVPGSSSWHSFDENLKVKATTIHISSGLFPH